MSKYNLFMVRFANVITTMSQVWPATHRYELDVHQAQQGVAFSGEPGHLVKRCHRVIAEGDRPENVMEYRRHLSGHVPSRLDFLTAQDIGDPAFSLSGVAIRRFNDPFEPCSRS